MALIFFASSDAKSYENSASILEPLLNWLIPHLQHTHIEIIHHLSRKLAHFTEYAVLALLLWRAIRNTRGHTLPTMAQAKQRLPKRIGHWQWEEAGIALFIVFFYAAADEFHQIFVPNRTPMFSDVCIDTCGGAVALIALWLFMLRQKTAKSLPEQH